MSNTALSTMAAAAVSAPPLPPPITQAGPVTAPPGAHQRRVRAAAQQGPEESPAALLHTLSESLQASIESGGWPEPLPAPHKYLLFMLLIAQPWPEAIATAMAATEHPATSHLLTSLAHIFANIYAIPYLVRSLAAAWVEWAGLSCYSIAAAWGDPHSTAPVTAPRTRAPRPRKLPAQKRAQRPASSSALARQHTLDDWLGRTWYEDSLMPDPTTNPLRG